MEDAIERCVFYNTSLNSFCKCWNTVLQNNKLQCSCGEERKIVQWTWEENESASVILSNHNCDALFHPIYSSGTAAVRGNVPFQKNLYHYWEIKILSSLYGTDVMIGVGTANIILSDWELRFCSMLGYNGESWGYSYKGVLQHNRLTCSYGNFFTIGSLIGVHLDMQEGTLEYYLNRKPLGIAFRNLKQYDLYPMVSSTAAQSAIRITSCLSTPTSLQIKCLKTIAKKSSLIEQLYSIPGLIKMLEKQYFWLIPPPPLKTKRMRLTLEDECVLPLSMLEDDEEHFCLISDIHDEYQHDQPLDL